MGSQLDFFTFSMKIWSLALLVALPAVTPLARYKFYWDKPHVLLVAFNPYGTTSCVLMPFFQL